MHKTPSLTTFTASFVRPPAIATMLKESAQHFMLAGTTFGRIAQR
jgi:hypothetical protein